MEKKSCHQTQYQVKQETFGAHLINRPTLQGQLNANCLAKIVCVCV